MDDIERWLWIVVPEVTDVYAQHMQLSLRVLQLLRGCVVTGRGVLCGGVVCADDVELSAMLTVPLVAPLPSLAVLVGTKLGSKRIIAAVDVNAFPSIHNLFDEPMQIWRSQQS